jgi:hypothetical protein
MRIILSICVLIAFSNLSYSGEIKCVPRFPLGHYLVHNRIVVYAEVLKVKSDEIKIKIIKDLKTGESYNKMIRIRISKSNWSEQIATSEIFSLNGKYVIFGSQLNYFPYSYIYNEPCNRFIVSNDSLFIGLEYLKKLKQVDTALFYKKNTFDDSLMPFGYKVSIDYFADMITLLQNSFRKNDQHEYEIYSYRRRFLLRQKRLKVFGYTYKELISNDNFINAVVNELLEAWGMCNERPINALD